MSGLTLDAGALIALDRGDRRVIVLLARGRERKERVTVPATVAAQAIRKPSVQARLVRLLRDPFTDLVPLDASDATAVGILLERTRTSDIADAHLVLCARRARQPIVTGDAKDLARLDPDAILVAL